MQSRPLSILTNRPKLHPLSILRGLFPINEPPRPKGRGILGWKTKNLSPQSGGECTLRDSKRTDGIDVAEQIGLDKIRNECKHFADWIAKLTAWAKEGAQ